MGGESAVKRAFGGLRRTVKQPILFHMENFSTPRRALVPVAANLLTFLALVCTAWWSSDQRPMPEQPRRMVLVAPAASPAPAVSPSLVRDSTDQASDLVVPARAALNSAALERDSLRTVGFVAGPAR